MTVMTTTPNLFSTSLVYNQLYHFLNYPTENTGISLARNGGMDFIKELNDDSIKKKADALRTEMVSKRLQDLQVEYVRLFDYRPACPPCESAYRINIKRSQLMKDLVECYREAGIECMQSFAPDHFSVEFEFMHYLAYQEENAERKNRHEWREKRREFLENHILKWVPDFCCQMMAEAQNPFKLLAQIIGDFIQDEKALLAPFGKKVEVSVS